MITAQVREIIKFNLSDFAQKEKLHMVNAFHAIKYIEGEGYWEPD